MTTTFIIEKLNELAQETIFFGPQGFHLALNQKSIKKFQIGFSVNKNGQNLCGLQPGQWQKSWLIIAKDTELGDPYFIDTLDANMAVYTGVFHHNIWHRELVAVNLNAFIACLSQLKTLGLQTSAHFMPDDTSIRDNKIVNQLQAKLIQLSHSESFWQHFIEGYRDWLIDDEY